MQPGTPVGNQARDRRNLRRDRGVLGKTAIGFVCGGMLMGTLLVLFHPAAGASACRSLGQTQTHLLGTAAMRQSPQLNLSTQCAAAVAWITTLAPVANAQTAASVNAFFIGNSGTDEIGEGITAVFQGSGASLTQGKFSIPGAPLAWLWHHQNSNGKDQSPLTQIRRLKPNHLTLMPIYRSPEGTGTPVSEDHIARSKESPIEAGDIRIGSLFYAEALRNNPEARLWLYSVWPNNQEAKYQTAAAWDAWGLERYQENQVTRAGIAQSTGGRVAIIPAATGLATLRDTLNQTQSQFVKAHFEDGLHLNATGRYFIGLLFYTYTTGRNPVTTVTDNGPLPAEVATQYKQVAWQVWNQFPPEN